MNKVVIVLVETILEKNEIKVNVNEVISFVSRQINIMPDYMRLGIKLITRVFDIAFVPVYFTPFSRLKLDTRLILLDKLRRKKYPVVSDLLRFFQTLVLLKALELNDKN